MDPVSYTARSARAILGVEMASVCICAYLFIYKRSNCLWARPTVTIERLGSYCDRWPSTIGNSPQNQQCGNPSTASPVRVPKKQRLGRFSGSVMVTESRYLTGQIPPNVFERYDHLHSKGFGLNAIDGIVQSQWRLLAAIVVVAIVPSAFDLKMTPFYYSFTSLHFLHNWIPLKCSEI